MIKIEVEIVGSEKTPRATMRQLLEETVQRRANEGWTLRSSASRGGSFYLVFAKKEKP